MHESPFDRGEGREDSAVTRSVWKLFPNLSTWYFLLQIQWVENSQREWARLNEAETAACQKHPKCETENMKLCSVHRATRFTQPPFLRRVCRKLPRKHNRKEGNLHLFEGGYLGLFHVSRFTRWGPCVPACVCSLYLVIRRHWSAKWLSVHCGFKYIWPAPSAKCCYEDFVFYSLLSPCACLHFSKSPAPYGRVYYFSLYAPGIHFEYCCEQWAKAKAGYLVPSVLLFHSPDVLTTTSDWRGCPGGLSRGEMMAQTLDPVTSLQQHLLAAELSCCWACPRATNSFPCPHLSSVRELCYHRQCRLHPEQPAPRDACFEFQSWEGQGFIWGWEKIAGN